MENTERALDTLTQCIYKAIDKKIEKLFCDYEAIVLSSEGDYCTVLINNAKYKVKNGTAITFQRNDKVCTVLIDNCRYTAKNGTPFEFQKNDKCLVHYINGNQQKKLIIAKL